MKLFRSIDTYLLERYPILWHSKLLYLLLAGAVFWLGFFGAGFALTDLEIVKRRSMNDYFVESFALLFHVVLTIIVLCFWALAFFKKNAVRHYYPLQRFYFTRLYVCIALGFLALFSAPIPFQMGVRAKIHSFVTPEELQKDARTLNLALAFLRAGNEDGAYGIENRSWPKPFPLSVMHTPDPELYEWPTDFQTVNSAGDTATYFADDFPEHSVELNSLGLYQFFWAREIHRNVNCYDDSYQLITNFWVPDSTMRVLDNDILNYSDIRFPGSYAPIGSYVPEADNDYFDYHAGEAFAKFYVTPQHLDEFRTHYAPTIHRWVNNDRKDSIAATIRDFKKILTKYEIPHSLDERIITWILSKEEYVDLPQFLREDYTEGRMFYSDRFLAHIHHNPEAYYESLEGYNPQMGYDVFGIDMLYENAAYAYKMGRQYEFSSDLIYFTIVLIVALALALLFLQFDFTNFVQFLIAIPSAGVIMILCGFGAALIDMSVHREEEKYILTMIFLVILSLLMLSVLSVLGRGFNKRFAGVVLNVGYWAAPLLPIFFILTMSMFTRVRDYDACGHELYWRDDNFWMSLLENPWAMIPVCVTAAACYFALIKRWYAKEE